MRFELTLYDTESRTDRAVEYTENRRRAAVWALMPDVHLVGSGHKLIWRSAEARGPRLPEIRLDSHFDRQLGELHQQVRQAKSLTHTQAKWLEHLRDGEHFGPHRKTIARLVAAELVEGSTRIGYVITDKGRKFLEYRALP